MKKFTITVGSSEIWYRDYIVEANNEKEARTYLTNPDINGKLIREKHWDTDYAEVLGCEEVI